MVIFITMRSGNQICLFTSKAKKESVKKQSLIYYLYEQLERAKKLLDCKVTQSLQSTFRNQSRDGDVNFIFGGVTFPWFPFCFRQHLNEQALKTCFNSNLFLSARSPFSIFAASRGFTLSFKQPLPS